ncbi:MAG: fructosamine kinase family protein, partial [Bacteroidota bacterium]|nr:fructosamine kinase family protein [Bacteroidota bacterium]
FIEPDNKKDNFWELFGHKLAILHKNHQQKFGLGYDNYIGSLPQRNTFAFESVDFFINARILPQLRILEKRLSISLYSDFDNLFKWLPNLIPVEKPSLLHGDLWNGNYLVNKNGDPTLIDPSIYYGSREVDIAMTKLFGGFPKEFYISYNLHFPLMDNWEDRIDIWNLYPLLIHANLFGGDYLSQIQAILKRFSD